MVRVADVQQRLLVPLPPARARGDADGDLVARAVPRGRGTGEAHAARGVGRRRSTVATDSHAGLLEPAEAAEGSAREGLRVHAPERGTRGTHLELRADRRRLPRRPSLRAAPPCAAVDQRVSLRQADSRPRFLSAVVEANEATTSREAAPMSTTTTYADVVEGVRATIAAYTQA